MRFTKSHLGLLLPLFAACAAPSNEPTGTASSAVNPEGSINKETFTFSLSGLDVTQQVGGGTIYGAIGAALNTQPQTQEGCSFGTWSGQAMGVCQEGGTTGALKGSYLQQIVPVTAESDIVTLGLVLDNTGITPPAVTNSDLGTTFTIAGDQLQSAGALIGIANGVIGGIVSAVGSVLSLLGGEIGLTGTETFFPCNGGLVQGPATPWKQVLPMNLIPSGSPVTGPYWGVPNPTFDTITRAFSVSQLEALTAYGPYTVDFPLSIQWPSSQAGYSIQLLGDAPGYCDSAMTLHLTIQRGVPNAPAGTALDGPAADPLAGSIGVARTGGEVDALVVDPAEDGLADVQWTPNAWSPSLVTPSIYATGTYAPTATLSRSLPPPGASVQLVAPPKGSAPLTPGSTNLSSSVDSFWFDANGNLNWTDWQAATGWATTSIGPAVGGVPNGRLSATSRTPANMDVFWTDSLGALWNDDYYLNVFHPAKVTTGLPANGSVAAVSRTFDTMDVLYIGTNGAFYDASFSGTAWTIKSWGNAGIAPAGAYITAVARDANTIDAFFVGNNKSVYQAHFTYGAVNGLPPGWNAPTQLAGLTGTAGAPISAVSRTQSSLDLVYLNGTSIEFAENAGTGVVGWSAPAQIASTGPVNPATELSLVARDQLDLTLIYRDAFGNSMHGGTWTQGSDMTSWQLSEPTLPTWKWQGWDSATGGLVSDPTVASPNASEIVTAATGPDGTIWYEIHDSAASASWPGWHSLGNKGHALTDAPVMVAANGKLQIFVRDPVTQHLLHQEGTCASATSCDAPVWNSAGWEELTNALSPTPLIPGAPAVVVSQPNNQINVFATGTDGSAHLIKGTGYGQMGAIYQWVGLPGGAGYNEYLGDGLWTNLSGGVLDEPAATSWGANRLDVVVRGNDSTLWHRYSNDNGVTWCPRTTTGKASADRPRRRRWPFPGA